MVWQPAEGIKAPFAYDEEGEGKKVSKEVIKNEQAQLQKELLDRVEPQPDPPKKPKKIVTVFDSHKGYINDKTTK